ncbi:DUF2332 family protein [Agrobacterium sp.]|uniref:DUF2332 domain-containing protein n=1 Tax=Agrobacterium sp. TaxID=361 RepID=UPI0028ABC10D|nr:DUF2332 family protein [Agrobacterium sp.]
MSEADVRQAFEKQAVACDTLGSPFTARLCRLVAKHLDRQTIVGQTILDWPGDASHAADSVPLRLAGALHALVVLGVGSSLQHVYPPHKSSDEELWPAVADALRQRTDFILERLKSAPQTNEVRRSAALLPGFMTIAALTGKPLMLSEVGASAGLNLQWDFYQYQLGDVAWGDTSPVFLKPEWRGKQPLSVPIDILQRAGCDLNPLDPSSAEDRQRLISYLWADQAERIERTANALEIAHQHHLTVTRADAVDWLKTRLSEVHNGACHVIYHSIAWQYLPAALQQQGLELIEHAGHNASENAPLAHLQMEADDTPGSASLTLQLWPTGEKHQIGRADFHGRWVEWFGWLGL